VLREIAGLHGAARHEIRVACSEGPAQGFLPLAMADFRRDWPQIRFALHVGSPLEATRRVAEGEADLALTFNVERGKGVTVRHSRRAPVYAVMARSHPLAGRKAIGLAELGAYPLALSGAGTTTRRLFELGCSLDSVTLEPALSTNYSGALHGFVRQSDAIMLSGYVSVAWRLELDGLVAVPISNAELQSRTLQLQVMQGRLLAPEVEAFIALLAGKLDALPM
jgi:DNA-binding transcriptional LysR family regulator